MCVGRNPDQDLAVKPGELKRKPNGAKDLPLSSQAGPVSSRGGIQRNALAVGLPPPQISTDELLDPKISSGGATCPASVTTQGSAIAPGETMQDKLARDLAKEYIDDLFADF